MFVGWVERKRNPTKYVYILGRFGESMPNTTNAIRAFGVDLAYGIWRETAPTAPAKWSD